MLSPTRHLRSSKVPDVAASFWFIKILTTAMGESTSDFLVHRFPPVLAVVVGGLDWGPGNVAMVLTLVIALGVGTLALRTARHK